MHIKPLHDRIVVKQKKEAEMTAGGLFIPTTAQEKALEGEVLAVGSGRVLDNGEALPISVKVGQMVLFAKHSYTEVKLDGEEYIILREDNIMGVIE